MEGEQSQTRQLLARFEKMKVLYRIANVRLAPKADFCSPLDNLTIEQMLNEAHLEWVALLAEKVRQTFVVNRAGPPSTLANMGVGVAARPLDDANRPFF